MEAIDKFKLYQETNDTSVLLSIIEKKECTGHCRREQYLYNEDTDFGYSDDLRFTVYCPLFTQPCCADIAPRAKKDGSLSFEVFAAVSANETKQRVYQTALELYVRKFGKESLFERVL